MKNLKVKSFLITLGIFLTVIGLVLFIYYSEFAYILFVPTGFLVTWYCVYKVLK